MPEKVEMREDEFFKRILPPVTITDDELDRSIPPWPGFFEGVTHYVFREAMDEDKTLFVARCTRDYPRRHVSVFRGTEKECHEYVLVNQWKADTPSLKRIPGVTPMGIPGIYVRKTLPDL